MGEHGASEVTRWRTGRKVGRTVYAQHGPEPSDDDTLIGVMDTREFAEMAVEAVNFWIDALSGAESSSPDREGVNRGHI